MSKELHKCIDCKFYSYIGKPPVGHCTIDGIAYLAYDAWRCENGFEPKQSQQIRQFDSGATRDQDLDKIDFEGFLSPIVLNRFGQYMHKHRKQSDGKLRDSDNWQKGIPLKEYMKSKWRHFMQTWTLHRLGIDKIRGPLMPEDLDELEDSLCAEIFNTMGYLCEILKKKNA